MPARKILAQQLRADASVVLAKLKELGEAIAARMRLAADILEQEYERSVQRPIRPDDFSARQPPGSESSA